VTKKQKAERRKMMSRARARAMGKIMRHRERPIKTNVVHLRVPPEHEPKKRSRVARGDSFVLVGGWQLKYEPEYVARLLRLAAAADEQASRCVDLAIRAHVSASRKAKLERQFHQHTRRAKILRAGVEQARRQGEDDAA